MHALSFAMTAQINRECYVSALSNSRCDFYVLIDFKFVRRCDLKRISIEKRVVSEFEEKEKAIDHAIVFVMNIDDNYQREI